jgi:cytochrome c oxidase subunit 3
MNIFRQLTEKPWLPSEDSIEGLQGSQAAVATPTVRVGLKLFLVVVGVLFFLLTITYAGRMAFEDWRPVPQPRLMWQNTVMLILASVAMQWAQTATKRDQWENVMLGLVAGGVLTFAFIVGQLLAWKQLASQGVFELTNPAIALFILITGLHGLHLFGGLIAWSRTTERVWRIDGLEAASVRLNVELCTLYWHFMLVVWLVLFGLLFSGNNNLEFLLAICGIR